MSDDSWWRRVGRRLRGGRAAAPPAKPPPARPAPPPEDPARAALAPIRDVIRGAPDPLRRALAALSAAEGTALERAAIDAALAARRAGRAPDELVVAAADLLVQRGQADRALEALTGVHASPALVMAADLRAERGELAQALALVERVLARDIDWPGARERHARWSQRLGAVAPAAAPSDQPTVLRHDLPATDLRIVGEAGRGGAGVVYEAMDDVLGRKVALKVYHRAAEERDKLEREARLAVALAGPGVIRVFDVDPERGWIIMEWLPGGALKRWLGRAERDVLWPVERWFVPLLVALSRVHAAGLVHADLKPANVLFRDTAEPVISDFGLALPPGTVLDGGSLGYLSPERLAARPLTTADDVYALGRLLDDALDALERSSGAAPPAAGLEVWRELARGATGPVASRPADANALLDEVRARVLPHSS